MKFFDSEKENIIYDFERLIKYLKLAIQNIDEQKEDIIDELKRWKSKTTIDELNENLPIILKKVTNWYEMYKKTGNILEISLKKYDWVSKETSYILGECALVDDLYAEIIHFVIGNIGIEMCEAIKKGGKTNE